MSCKKETTSGRQAVSVTDPQIGSSGIDADALKDSLGNRHAVVQEVLSTPDFLQQPQEVHRDSVVQEVLENPGVVPEQQVVAMPEERDLSLEVLALMATVVFTYIATAMSYPFESLSFKHRFGVWITVFVGLWLLLIIWWKSNNGDRHLLSIALRQIRGTGGF